MDTKKISFNHFFQYTDALPYFLLAQIFVKTVASAVAELKVWMKDNCRGIKRTVYFFVF